MNERQKPKYWSVLGRMTENEQGDVFNVYWQHMDWNKKPFLKSCCSNRAEPKANWATNRGQFT